MSYKIIVDSCGELPDRCKKDPHFESVPLVLDIDGYSIVDDETFDQGDFLKRVAASPNCPKSSCPSPERYMQAYDCDADNVYAVTLIALKVEECEKAGLGFREVIEKVEAYIEAQHTYFVLESLEALRKNGRLSNLKAFVANALNIKPVMGSTPKGTICQLDQARGINRALKKMVDYIVDGVKSPEEKILAISHCNCQERAQMVKEEILKRVSVKDVIVLDTAGISSLYASDGGVIVVV